MSSTQVDRPTKVGQQVNKKENEKSRKLFNPSHKKHNKHDESRYFKFGRKRLQSFTGNGKFFPPYKRRKKEGAIIPPTKFLLGGNICDPLNLNSMQDEEINRAMNAVTPKSSPLPTPKHRKEAIEVIIPPNICDPLNLSNCNDNDNDEYEKQLISPTKKGAKRRNRKRKRASSGSGKDDANDSAEAKPKEEATLPEPVEATPVAMLPAETPLPAPASPPPVAANTPVKQEPKPQESSPIKDKSKLRLKGLDDSKDKRLRKLDIKDKIVSPVIPQPGAWKPRLPHRPSQDKKKKQQQQHHHHHHQQQQPQLQQQQQQQQQEQQQPQKMPNFRVKNAQYQYGNYNRYYGYRNPHHDVDTRLTVFAQRKELFAGKDILDIGCNIGHITLSVARDFAAHSVTGIDIDRKLIGIARKNIKHYVNCVSSPASNDDGGTGQRDCDASFFPLSMPISYGPIDVPGFSKNKDHKGFPYNVTFVQGNYVLEDDALLTSEQPQFDTILCLSTTKWIHLNFGDAGLKQAFKRMHAQLRPGGVLILESQGWASYGKKKNLTERTYKTYQSIEFFPQKFTQYLLSSEVGFNRCEVVSIPAHPSKGFQRPIQLFTKTGTSPASTADNAEVGSHRFVAREQQQKDFERRAFERDLFPHELPKSDLSQRSAESLSQYEQLENIYAPSTTPCYDTPSHNADSQPFEPEKMCYVELNSKDEPNKQESSSSKPIKPNTESDQQQQTIENSNILQRKRKFQESSLSNKVSNGDIDSTEITDAKKTPVVINEAIKQETSAIKKIADVTPNQSEQLTATDIAERKEDFPTNHQREKSLFVLSKQKVAVSPCSPESNKEKT